jgi:hypothetical protein
MALVDYWMLICPLAIESGFNIALSPAMTDNPTYLSLYREEGDPVYFEPVFNQPEDFGEPGAHIGVRLRNPRATHKDYLRYILNQLSVESAAEQTWLHTEQDFRAYIWKPIPYDPEELAWEAIPHAQVEAYTAWHLHYLKQTRAAFFHEGA